MIFFFIVPVHLLPLRLAFPILVTEKVRGLNLLNLHHLIHPPVKPPSDPFVWRRSSERDALGSKLLHCITITDPQDLDLLRKQAMRHHLLQALTDKVVDLFPVPFHGSLIL